MSVEKTKISYVLPVYNAQSTIAQSITSLSLQYVKPHEIIVIDDGSTDRTPHLLEHLKKEGKITTLITNEKRKGAAYSRNLGNSLATGDIIAVCDTDFYYRNRSSAIVEFFNKYWDEYDIFYSALLLRDSKSSLNMGKMEAIKWDFNSKCPISHPTVAYKREVVEKCKYCEKTKESDLYEFFLLDCYRSGFKFYGCQDPLLVKIEGNSKRKVSKVKQTIKQKKYKEYGIEVIL